MDSHNDRQSDIYRADLLIVDDTPDNLRVLARMLSRNGYNVRKALNGQMALTACQNSVPELILLDIMMPGIDGYEVCQRLKANDATRDVPVIFLSALTDANDKVKAFQSGGVDYIAKPFQLEEVLARVRHHLALRLAKLEILELNAQLERRVRDRTQQLEQSNTQLRQEVIERRRLQSELLHLAMHDSLTNLPNRTLFMEQLKRVLDRARCDPNYQFAVLFLDCDRFKTINDSLGHSVGDELLEAIATRLSEMLEETDLLARLGGDEFAILLEDLGDRDRAVTVAETTIAALSSPFSLSRHEVFINASIGIAYGDRDTEKPEYLLRDADTAMYRAKGSGKGRYRVFDPHMHREAIALLHLENDLRRAIEREEFIIHYQPIVSLQTGKIAGFEALVRWQHPQRGLVSPAEFIPLAEETGLIAQIDLWVLERAWDESRRWQRYGNGGQPLLVSVNLSVPLFAQPSLTDRIDRIMETRKLDPQYLKLEITETAILEDRTSAKNTIDTLRSRQIQLSIDDFGTGYSSLSYLHELPVDTLKIDRSFIQRLNGSPHKKGIVPAILSMTHTLEMDAIAEGIETPEQFAQLQQLNCDFGQGYFFAKPMNRKLALELLESSPQWRL